MSFEEDGTGEEMDMEEIFPEIENLKPEFIRLMRKRLEIEDSVRDEAERRAATEEIFKQQMRGAFLTHTLATEEDFERLWPRLRDDSLCEHANTVYFQVIDAIAEELEDEDEI